MPETVLGCVGKNNQQHRALLAKAEATDDPAEAETFTAKAQELMTRHAVDEAVLRSSQQDEIPVATRRVHLQPPDAGDRRVRAPVPTHQDEGVRLPRPARLGGGPGGRRPAALVAGQLSA